MTASFPAIEFSESLAVLNRHEVRRSNGIATISVLVGPGGAAIGLWRRWTGNSPTVIGRNSFLLREWLLSVAQRLDVPTIIIRQAALRQGRDPDEFLAAWSASTMADRERYWATAAPGADDEILRTWMTRLPEPHSPEAVVDTLLGFGDAIVLALLRLLPRASWPGVVFMPRSQDDFSSTASLAAQWALQAPALPVAIVVTAEVWQAFLATAPESRVKAILKEGEVLVPHVAADVIEHALKEAGLAPGAASVLAANGADASLVEAAVEAQRENAAPPNTTEEDDRARSAAERFLFQCLESMPETAGQFELNGTLDFQFGPRRAEIDLLGRSLRIAIEVDGYFHFLQADSYRRDRAKDWELQSRGFLVLRFLAEDVLPRLETIRDRILDAVALQTQGGLHDRDDHRAACRR